MGQPTHYSAEIATRCQQVNQTRAEQVRGDADLTRDIRGSLLTTSLLATSTHMIMPLMQRLYKPALDRPGGSALPAPGPLP